MATTPAGPRPQDPSFAETALTLGGKSEDEAKRTGAIDKADDQVEALFAKQYQTTASPAHRAVWDDTGVPLDLFTFDPSPLPATAAKVMDDSLAIVKRHRHAKTLHDENGKLREQVLQELAAAGYWGLLVEPQYG